MNKTYGILVVSYDNDLYRFFDKIRIDQLIKENVPFKIIYNGLGPNWKLNDWERYFIDNSMNPIMYNKFIHTCEVLSENDTWKKLKYILRINSSTFLNCNKINHLLKQLPDDNCFAGRPLGPDCLSGLYTFFSWDILKKYINYGLIKNNNELSFLNDDVILGKLATKLNIQRTLLQDNLYEFFQLNSNPSIDEIKKASNSPLIRVKCGNREVIDKYIWKELYKETQMITIEEMYKRKCVMQSDINEHLPTLAEYAAKCESVIEMGVRDVVSTWALLQGKPKTLTSIDIAYPNPKFSIDINQIKDIAKKEGIDFNFILGNTLQLTIPKTDLLFIDTLHRYSQLKQELELHANNVNKFIVLHDTVSYAHYDESNHANVQDKYQGKSGLLAAIEEFLLSNPNWKIHKHFPNNNGLMILERT